MNPSAYKYYTNAHKMPIKTKTSCEALSLYSIKEVLNLAHVNLFHCQRIANWFWWIVCKTDSWQSERKLDATGLCFSHYAEA